MTPILFKELQRSAKFTGVSGCRADSIVSDELGHLFIIDSTGNSHSVNPVEFVAVSPDWGTK
jgi:hypothetical protein